VFARRWRQAMQRAGKRRAIAESPVLLAFRSCRLPPGRSCRPADPAARPILPPLPLAAPAACRPADPADPAARPILPPADPAACRSCQKKRLPIYRFAMYTEKGGAMLRRDR